MIASLSQQLNQPQTLAYAPATQADMERRQKMQESWKAYRGELQDPLKVDKDQPNDNVKVNRCAPVVDKGVSFLFGPVVKIECVDEDADDTDREPRRIDDTGSDEPSDEQQYVDSFWGDDDDKMSMLTEIATNGAVCGTPFVKLIPPQEGMECPRLITLDPQLIRIITHPEDCTQALAYIIEYPSVADYQKRQVIARVDPQSDVTKLGNADIEDTWTITNYLRKGGSGSWFQDGDTEDWLYPFPPIFHCKNLPNPNEAYGMPDTSSDIIGMNKSINFALSNISRIIKYHGHPKTWMKGVRAAQIQVAVDDTIVLESENAEIGALAAMENFSGLLAVVADLRSDMDEQSRIPSVALGRLVELPKGNISGVALQLLFQPLIEKTTLKRRLYGRMVRDITRAALVLGGKLPVEQYATYKVELHWENLLPIDDLAAAQTALILSQLGVSQDTLMQELGYDASAEADKSAKEDAVKAQKFAQGQEMPPTNPMQTQQMSTPPGGQSGGSGGHPGGGTGSYKAGHHY